MRHSLRQLALAALVGLLAACGSDAEHPTSLVVFGDSLSDVGTYNVGTIAALGAGTGGAGRWTINSVAGGEMWVERIASELGLPKPCAAETGLLPNLPGISGAPVTAHPGCTNYAQGSARVTSPVGPSTVALQAAPFNQQTLGLMGKPVQNQMEAHLTASGGAISPGALVLVLAGANDIFMEASLTAPSSPQTAVANVAAAGAALGQLVKTKLVDKGARHVLVLNIPDITTTPFARTLDSATRGLIDTMVTTFNAQLAAQLAGISQVRVGDLYARSKDQAANPAKYALSNVTTQACGPNALGSNSLVCNAGNVIAGDVSRYAFADDVHPTPYGHQLIAAFATELLLAANWH